MDILIVKPKWAELILSGQKIWEIRGSNTSKRGIIGIAESGTGKVFGEVELINSRRMTHGDYVSGKHRHCLEYFRTSVPDTVQMEIIASYIDWENLRNIYQTPYIWELRNAKRYDEPKPYNHPKGAVIWVKGE